MLLSCYFATIMLTCQCPVALLLSCCVPTMMASYSHAASPLSSLSCCLVTVIPPCQYDATLPLSCCLAAIMLPCCCHATLPLSCCLANCHTALLLSCWIATMLACHCHAGVPLSCCPSVVISAMLPCRCHHCQRIGVQG